MSRNQGITQGSSVLIVTTVASTLEAFLLPFARALRAEGMRVDALAADATNCAGIADEFDQRFDIGWSRSVGSLLRYRRLARELRVLVQREQYETIWVHTPIAALVTRAALRRRRRKQANAPKIIYTAHGFHFFGGGRPLLEQWFYRFIEYLALRWTDVLVVMNDEDEAAARRWFAHPRKRCNLVRIDGIGVDSTAWASLALDDAHSNKLRRRWQIPMGSFVITMVAEMNANKRHRLLIEAVALLQHEHSLPWMRLLLIGQGPLEDELRALVTDRDLDKTVIFTDQLSPSELHELLALTNLGMLVSEREGLPRSLMEMCASGVLLAGTQTRGIIDEVADERALADEPTAKALAYLIERLAKKPSLRAELIQKQYERLQERYELRRVLPQYLKLLR